MNKRFPFSVSVSVLLVFGIQSATRGQTTPPPVPEYRNPVAAVPLAALKATRERPLFSATRRPPPTGAVAAPAIPPTAIAVMEEPPKPPPFMLVGTVIGPKDRIAIVITEGDGAAARLREGGVADGWMLVSVNRRSVSLIRDGRTVTLELHRATEAQGGSPDSANTADAVGGDGIAANPFPSPAKLQSIIK